MQDDRQSVKEKTYIHTYILFSNVLSVRSMIQIRILIKKLDGSTSTGTISILKDLNVVKPLSYLYDMYVVIHAEEDPTNIVFVCKSHYIDCLIKVLRIDHSLGYLIHIHRRH